MKKIVTAVLTLSICFAKAYSQTQWGIKAGLNLAQIENAEYFEPGKSRLGLNGGLLVRFNVNYKFFIQPEALYSGKGFKFTGRQYNSPGDFYPVTCVSSLHYLSVPVLAGFRLSERFSFLLGPEASYLIKATTSYEEGKQNNTPSYKRFDLALDFGAVFKLNKRLAFDFRYSRGFHILSGAPTTETQYDLDMYGIYEGSNRTLQFDLVYLINAN